VIVRSKLEHALRVRGYNDGYDRREKAFPKENLYLQSYEHGRQARAKEDRKQAAR
jgi:hypothetical protein